MQIKLKIGDFSLKTKEILAFLLLAFSYFLTRLTNLTLIPVFADEAIYIRWAQVMRAVSSLRFLPLSDGKQPLFMWLVIPFLKVFNDPLFAGRCLSVLAGLGTMVGVFTLSYLLFKKKSVSFFACLLYLISPFALFFDRLTLVDGLLSFFCLWFLIISVLLAKNQRLDLAMIAGILLGLGLITKSPAMIFALLLPLTVLLFPFKEKNKKKIGKLTFLWLIIYFFALVIYNILRLGPEFHMIGLRNKDYIFSFSEILAHPFNPLVGNLKEVLDWNFVLLTPLVFLLAIGGVILSLRKNFKASLLLFSFWILPLMAQSLIAKVYTARYIFFSVPLILIFSAYFLEHLFYAVKNKFLTITILTILFILPVYQSTLLLLAPQKAWLPSNERKGYFEQWTAGYGIKESADYLKEVAKEQKILVGTEGYFGTLPDGLQIYLEKVPNTTVIGVGYPIKEIPEKLSNGLTDNRVFLLVNDSRFFVSDAQDFKLIARYPKAVNPKTNSQENLLFFELVK